MTSVVVADDHPVFRRGLRELLHADGHYRVVAEATTGAEAVAAVLEHRPDVVVMDVRMPDLDGVEATRRLLAAAPGTSVLVVTMHDDVALASAALRAGASGFLLKDAADGELLRGVAAVAAGQSILPAGMAGRILAGRPTGVPDSFTRLTGRERQVLELLGGGRGNAAIAAELGLTVKTVRNLVSTVLVKLGLPDRLSAALLAREQGLVRDVSRDS